MLRAHLNKNVQNSKSLKKKSYLKLSTNKVSTISIFCLTFLFLEEIDLVYTWYNGKYNRIMVVHRDFAEAAKCSFWKITLDHRHFDISTVIPNIHLVIYNSEVSKFFSKKIHYLNFLYKF
jgi:hypothetical protein